MSECQKRMRLNFASRESEIVCELVTRDEESMVKVKFVVLENNDANSIHAVVGRTPIITFFLREYLEGAGFGFYENLPLQLSTNLNFFSPSYFEVFSDILLLNGPSRRVSFSIR